MLSVNQLTRFGFNEKGEVNSVLSTSYPYNAPDLGICDVYRRGTVVLCNNGVVSEFSVKNNQLVAKNISSLFPPLEGRYGGRLFIIMVRYGWVRIADCLIVQSRNSIALLPTIRSSTK